MLVSEWGFELEIGSADAWDAEMAPASALLLVPEWGIELEIGLDGPLPESKALPMEGQNGRTHRWMQWDA